MVDRHQPKKRVRQGQIQPANSSTLIQRPASGEDVSYTQDQLITGENLPSSQLINLVELAGKPVERAGVGAGGRLSLQKKQMERSIFTNNAADDYDASILQTDPNQRSPNFQCNIDSELAQGLNDEQASSFNLIQNYLNRMKASQVNADDPSNGKGDTAGVGAPKIFFTGPKNEAVAKADPDEQSSV